MKNIPKSHPRYHSLVTRELISEAMKKGLVHETGLIAHGRGEAFDYLLGETTIPPAEVAEKTAAAALLCAANPVISINGNVAALAADECISLAKSVPAKLEINLFHRSQRRIKKINDLLQNKGVKKIYGLNPDARIPGLESNRAYCSKEGIFTADVVLVPLEDGDRCQALQRMGKTVIAIDLNPLSRTAQAATITIVDNVTRAVPRIEQWMHVLKNLKRSQLEEMVKEWDNTKNRRAVMTFLSKRLNSLS
ncbi:MAG TPA: phosphopantothenate/pantothenate synthetase [Thermoplasmatales archaeon]|nr:phosphopantothenate/pantothenate synthetase [Thermoplasmatales archaeon]